MNEVDKLFKEADTLKQNYRNHFNMDIPDNIIGWWNPLNIADHPEELEAGIKAMAEDVQQAIDTNTPIEEIPIESWEKIIF
ncbi:hypothetical protein [Candidatus Enterococcus clewellii]|uniref:Uncharacterized protein n=1 Tax=Candidatus Enterococcus clewellii TaxID=1834193 RepID=A0A242K896_9ENTE|nr:hypothetical protein [Enterococcus sp. 9E7_DIV0242]OTP17287.1 hypothetical protein A5888_001425 [Enterococcus sp. 9E7_DIV0242]